MEKTYGKARAKINLTLNVLDKRKDNYHNIESIFQKINLYDEIYITKTEQSGIELNTNWKDIENQDNIIYKAYHKLKEKHENITGIRVTLIKIIPMQAGLAGGSSDCACFLKLMNKLFSLNMTKKEIIEMGKSLGADVVPCLYNGSIKAEGIGDIVSKIKANFKYYILIVKPELSCNTKEMYTKLDLRKEIVSNQATKNVICALENQDIKILCKNLFNSFEKVMQEPIIETMKEDILKCGAIRKFNGWFRLMCLWNF